MENGQVGMAPETGLDARASGFTLSELGVDIEVMSPDVRRWLFKGSTRVSPDGVRRPRRMNTRGRSPSHVSLVGLFNAQSGLCCYCSQPMTLPPIRKRRKWPTDAEMANMDAESHPPTEVTRDHLWPRSQGGPGILSNFAAACRLCNQEKGDLPLVIFLLARATNTVGDVHRRQIHIREALAKPATRFG